MNTVLIRNTSMKKDLKATFGPKNSCWEKFVPILYKQGSGPSQFEKSGPNPDKSRPDPQH
jgi:hypothetical protein